MENNVDNIECYLLHLMLFITLFKSSFFYSCSLPSGISMDSAGYFVYFEGGGGGGWVFHLFFFF